MKISVKRGGVPNGVVVGAFGAAAAILVRVFGLERLPVGLCFFRRITGLPCATCGSTRALARLASGQLGAALHANPLAVLAFLGIGAWAALDLVLLLRGRALSIDLSERDARIVAGMGLAALVVNWAYLLVNLR